MVLRVRSRSRRISHTAGIAWGSLYRAPTVSDLLAKNGLNIERSVLVPYMTGKACNGIDIRFRVCEKKSQKVASKRGTTHFLAIARNDTHSETDRVLPIWFHVKPRNPADYSSTQRSLSRFHEAISWPSKKSPISRCALSVASDPWIKFRPVINPRSPRIVPGAASTGFVFPMVDRVTATAFGPSSTITTTGPEVM